ncbi:helix-turn-helix domain-containing protein [Vagococcus sp. BWB3-3]|uniref:Helix-turn-helix domain-containing protein n=1 Tax=Vagococcus allomyrinae TaxID=2794353 RepID=A0A940SXG2_9ENTE|nr:helix-turn-helix domain-containing protein [Vagococcus allomyrinae]MBP1044295.1 helix-turn-helix domain-containing protein [Vagococcus allomyrinae]
MNEIGYRLIVDKKTKRKVDILNTLISASGPIKIETLSSLLNVTSKTLSNDLKELSELLPNSARLTYQESEGLVLKSENPFLIAKTINQLLAENPINTVVDSVFLGEGYTIDEYSDKLFISSSSLRLYLNQLRNLLLEFNLTLNTSPTISISGHEPEIRFFFFQYYRHAHEGSAVLPDSSQQNKLYNLVKATLDSKKRGLNLDFYRLLNWFWIIEQRIQHKKFVDLPQTSIDQLIDTSSFEIVKELINRLLTQDNLPEDEYVFFSLIQLDCVIYESKTKYFIDALPNHFSVFEPIISDLFSAEELHPAKLADLKMILSAFLSNTMILSDLTPLFQKVTGALKEHTFQHYSDTYRNWKSALSQKIDPNLITYDKDLAVSLTLITKSYYNLRKRDKQNILCSLTGAPSSLIYLKNMILNVLPNSTNVTFLFNKPLTNSIIDVLEIDVCIYNHHLIDTINVAKEIRLSNIPTEVEWSKILFELLKR